jgi:tRNA dimethylallyltransferase
MQVYRGLDIGTAKPTRQQRDEVPHHLIDLVDPDQLFSAADFADAADDVIEDIRLRGKRAIVVGGTGLYIRALLKGLVDSPGDCGEIRAGLREDAVRIGNEAMLEQIILCASSALSRYSR